MEFVTEDVVRDYECDLQGIVNNANYQHYLEHARHAYLRSKGVSFAGLHERGIDVVVAHVEISYKFALRPNDAYECTLRVEKQLVKYVFFQNIFRKCDHKLCVRAKTSCVAVINGRLSESPELDALL